MNRMAAAKEANRPGSPTLLTIQRAQLVPDLVCDVVWNVLDKERVVYLFVAAAVSGVR